MRLIIPILLFTVCFYFTQGQSSEPVCEVLNYEDVNYRHDVHPLLLENEEQRANGWSTQTSYGGCPNDCGNSGFDCCITMPCDKYQIPVVFTLLVEQDCSGQSIGIGQLNGFINKVNDFYDCLGVPFEFFKCTNWDASSENQLQDGSTRLVCNSDLSIFYLSDCADGNDPCCCGNDPACMANCNLQPDPFGDGNSDFSEAVSYNIPNVMNIYVPINYNGFTPGGFSEGGVAYFPAGDFSYGTAFGINGILNISDDCNGTSGSTVSIHEFGHFFGLLHTHGSVNNAQVNANDPNGNDWAECPDGSECCSLGDYICDTPPDPNTRPSNVEDSNGTDISNCVSNNGCDYDLSSCYSACGVPYPSNFTNNNIMSYGTCDNFLSECQIAKMVDALLCARNNLSCCDPDLVDSSEPEPYLSESIYYLCAGDNVPTFTIDNPAGDADNVGLNTNCIGWYASDNSTFDFNVLGIGLTFTPPTSGSGAINTSIPGTYTYYFDDDLNNYSLTTCQNDIRKQVTIVIADNPGGTANTISISDCDEDQAVSAANTQAELSSGNNLVGWYFSNENPTATLTSTSQINNALNVASTGNPNNPNLGEIYQSNNLAGIDVQAINCNTLEANGGDGTYYLTPFVAYEEEDIVCSVSNFGESVDWNGNQPGGTAGPFYPVLDCDAQGRTGYTYEIVIEISCNNQLDNFNFVIQPGIVCENQVPNGGISVPCSQSTFVFTEAMIQNEYPGYDPFTNAFCLNAINIINPDGNINYTATLNLIYPGSTAQIYWDTANSPNIFVNDETAGCFWGAPLEITCNCGNGDCFEIIDYDVQAGDCDLSGVEIQLLDEAGTVLDTQPINPNGSSGSFGTYFCGTYYMQLVNTPACFTDTGGSIGPKLINVDGDGFTYITFSPFQMVPTLSQWGIIIMILMLMLIGALKVAQQNLAVKNFC